MLPPRAFHQLFVQFADQSYGKREFFETRNAMLQCNHVVANFPEILGASIDDCTRLGREQFAEGGLCAFNLA
jgi:hypothetical protein